MSRLRWAPLALLGATLVVAGATQLFSTFMVYDDEGYVLFSLKTFAEGGGLYERVYSQYGPFFFLFNQGLHLAGLQFTNTDGRLLTLVCWLGAAGFCAASVWRLTRSMAATNVVFGGVFLHLLQMTDEPSHPGGLITLATAAAAWCGTRWTTAPRRLALATGLIGGALVLTKINVGVFLVAGAGGWWILHLEAPQFGPRTRSGLVVVAMALLPVALMRSQFSNRGAVIFALIAAAAGASVALAAARGARPLSRWRDLVAGSVAGLAVIALTGLAVTAQGTSLHGLLEGVLFGPLRHPTVYSAYTAWPASTVPVAVGLAIAAACAIAWPGTLTSRLVATGRVVAAAIYCAHWGLGGPLSAPKFALCFGLGLAWLFVLPLKGDERTQPGRAWLALLLVPQALHAFPVAGSQVGWGTFLWIPLVALGVHDVVRIFTASWRPAGLRVVAAAGSVLMLAVTVGCAQYAWLGLSRVRHADPLYLPGASELRLPERTATALRILSRNIVAHGDMLFSLPGMLSFNLWTDVPPPTPANVTHWFSLLSPAQQEAIRQRLADAPRAIVVVQRGLCDFLQRTGVSTASPLNTWLHQNYQPAFTLEDYELWVRNGRSIAALDTATLFEATPNSRESRYKISLTLAASALATTTSLELHRLGFSGSKIEQTWTNSDARLFLTPLNTAGATMGAPQRITLPFRASGIVRLDVFIDLFPTGFPHRQGAVYLLDAEGNRTAEARFIN